LAKYGQYHKTCFKCDTCCKPLDGPFSQYQETSEDNGLFCQRCFEGKFGSNPVIPQEHADTSTIIIAADGKGTF
jgi:hypothetical protein